MKAGNYLGSRLLYGRPDRLSLLRLIGIIMQSHHDGESSRQANSSQIPGTSVRIPHGDGADEGGSRDDEIASEAAWFDAFG